MWRGKQHNYDLSFTYACCTLRWHLEARWSIVQLIQDRELDTNPPPNTHTHTKPSPYSPQVGEGQQSSMNPLINLISAEYLCNTVDLLTEKKMFSSPDCGDGHPLTLTVHNHSFSFLPY